MHTRTEDKLLSLSRLKAKTKLKKKHNAICRRSRSSSIQPITPATFDGSLCQSMHSFRTHYQFTKTNVLAQTTTLLNITINKYQLGVVDEFTYLGSTIIIKLSFDKEIHRQIIKAACTLACRGTRVCSVWKNKVTQHRRINAVHMLSRES